MHSSDRMTQREVKRDKGKEGQKETKKGIHRGGDKGREIKY